MFSTDPKCCKKGVESLIPVWWSCPKLLGYWEMVHNEINLILKASLEFPPSCYLLHKYANKRDVILLNNIDFNENSYHKKLKVCFGHNKK